MTVRNATQDDIPRIVEMARTFYADSGYTAIAEASIPSLAGLAIITMESGVMLVAEADGAVVGMACLFVEPFTFNPSVMVASEIAWWVDPAHRGSLLAKEMLSVIDDRCKALGVNVIRMATLANSPPQAAALYERLGYTKADSYYMRIL